MGLQAKVIFSFLTLLSVAVGASCWLFHTHSRERLADSTAEQARQLASALTLGAEHEMRAGNAESLREMAQQLLQSRNVLYVAFLGPQAETIALASRDPDFYLQRTSVVPTEERDLMRARRKQSPVFGSFVEVVAPVLSASSSPPSASASGTAPAPATESVPAAVTRSAQRAIFGYVAVGLSQAGEEAQLRGTTYLVIGIGCVMMIFTVPLAYLLVRRIFSPIRELVRVTRKITAGDLDARVGIARTDVIGDLARSFNEMVIWVKKQQQDVAAANQKLHNVNRDLEAKVAARTAQVETAMERLSSEIREKEDFLRAVSHDLNAPLRNISGMASMLLMKYRDKLGEDVVHRLERIKTNVDVETDLIAELLELSRIKTRRQKFEPVDVEKLIWELRGLFENDLKSRAISLVLDTQLPVLDAERARVRQVFQNLIDNAVKYMGDSTTREIHVGCRLHMTEAEFYVRDTGMGIDPEDLDKVFFVFRRGKNSAAQNISGKGVGLASVKSIIETYNGKIWVESKLGEGTTFRFTINGKHVPAAVRQVEQASSSEWLESCAASVAAEMPAGTPADTPAEEFGEPREGEHEGAQRSAVTEPVLS